jgi:hypothetical protein
MSDDKTIDYSTWQTNELQAAAEDLTEALEALGGRNQAGRRMGTDAYNDWLEMTTKLAAIEAELWRRDKPLEPDPL